MRKQTIGKVQLWIGMILLIIGIVGITWVSLVKFKVSPAFENNVLESETKRLINEEYGSYENTPTEVKLMIAYNYGNENLEWKIDNRTNERILASTSLILIFLSLLFITQGLANKSEN